MARLLLIALLTLTLAACGGGAPTDDAGDLTALPPDDTAPQAALTPGTDVPIVVEGGGSFDDMNPLATEIEITGAITPAPDGRILTSYTVLPISDAGSQPRRRLVITVPLAGDEGGSASFTLFIPEGGGAGNLVRADAMTPDQFGVSAFAFPQTDSMFTVDDPTALSVQGDLRVLDATARLTAAFDFTLTNNATSESVRVVGRVNQIPSS